MIWIFSEKQHAMRLTAREKEILELLVRGLSNKQIAAEQGISPFTVRDHLARLALKHGAVNRVDLAARYSMWRHSQSAERHSAKPVAGPPPDI